MRTRAQHERGGILGAFHRLARDTRGGTYILFAMSFFPLLAMIGSGIDMSRAYMAQTRLQQACDAAALAGRRAMTDGTVDNTVKAEAQKFFKFNFPVGVDGTVGTGAFGTTGFLPVVGSAPNSTVTVEAKTVVPMSIMRLFGFVTLPISVKCNARLDFVNTDIVLVLDTTGSMLCATTESTCTNDDEKSSSKIKGLRTAVLSLYDTLKPVQTQLEANGLRLRFAIVPYSSSLNMGRVLRGIDTSYVASDTWTYQSRKGSWRHISTGLSSAQCTAKGGTIYNYNNTAYCVWTDDHPAGGTVNNTFLSWSYGAQTWDISTYATGSSTPTSSVAGTSTIVPTEEDGTTTSTWAGCIEERQTTRMTATDTSIPSGAYDLNIDLIPTSDKATKWKPYWPEVEWLQNDKGEEDKPQVACPTESKRLQVWTKANLTTYLNTLKADGGTYHDNGMMWGIRMLSGSGVFSADNPSTYGSMPVSKYIIFMTDGALDTGYDHLYSTYGIEELDKRVTPGGSSSNKADQYARHLNRFNLLCATAKNRGISIWVVAFAQGLTTSLSNCASNSSQASTSANSADLNDRFVEIGQNIGALRLTQ